MAQLDPSLTKYAQQDDKGNALDLTRYQTLPGGKGVVVPRRLPGGGNPMVDPRKGASQFTVVDIDEDEFGNLTTSVHAPGTTDVSGNPIPKEAACPSSPDPKTPQPPSPSAKRRPRKTAQTESPPTPSPRPQEKQAASSTPTCPPTPTIAPAQLTELLSELSRLREEMQELKTAPSQSVLASSLPEKPSSVTSVEPEASRAKTVVEFRAPYGVFRCVVHGIQRDDGLLALVYRADAEVQFVPSPGQDVQITWDGQTVVARPHGLAFKLQLGHTYLVVLLSIAE